jgi:hypothetical protein
MDGRKAAATLGVGPRATRDEIRRAFRARVKRAHPDVVGAGSDDAFIVLRAAFDVLMAAAPDPVPAPRPRRCQGPTGPAGAGLGPFAAGGPPPGRPRRSSIDLTDIETAGPVADRSRRVAVAGPGGPIRRDRRGLSFEDHLTAALAVSRPGSR